MHHHHNPSRSPLCHAPHPLNRPRQCDIISTFIYILPKPLVTTRYISAGLPRPHSHEQLHQGFARSIGAKSCAPNVFLYWQPYDTKRQTAFDIVLSNVFLTLLIHHFEESFELHRIYYRLLPYTFRFSYTCTIPSAPLRINPHKKESKRIFLSENFG